MKYLFLVLLCTSCASGKFSFTPVYNLQIAQEAQAGQNYFDTLYSKMLASDNKEYISYALDYVTGNSIINQIWLADSLRPKAVNIRLITSILRSHVLEYEQYHEANGTLTNGKIRAFKSDVHRFFEPLILDENNLAH